MRIWQNGIASIGVIFLAGCVRTSVMPLAANTVEITASAAPVCGAIGAQKAAVRDAAIETIRQGFDSFVIAGSGMQNNVGVVGYTPMTAHSFGTTTAMGDSNFATAYGSSTTTYSGGSPIFFGHHNQEILVHMFRRTDAGSNNAISARRLLGPHWKNIVKTGFSSTC